MVGKSKRKSSKSTTEYSLVEDLPLFSFGLFPFFGYSSSQCKPKVLEILQKYYYPLGAQLIPSIPGLINSIIVGMEDTNEELTKKVRWLSLTPLRSWLRWTLLAIAWG